MDEEIKANNAPEVFYGVMLIVCSIFIIAATTCASYDDLRKSIAKEYDIPLSKVEDIVGRKIGSDIKYFPLPHNVWYVTTERAEDIEVASGYFGNISLNKGALDEYFRLSNCQDIYRNVNGW